MAGYINTVTFETLLARVAQWLGSGQGVAENRNPHVRMPLPARSTGAGMKLVRYSALL